MPIRRLALACAALLLSAAAPPAVPVLRFAIDQDYTPQSQTPAQVARDLPLIRALNIRILRTGIGWDDTNPARGQFSWTYWQRVVAQARAAGVTVRPYYAYTPAWAGPAYNAPPQQTRNLATACAVMAAALGAQVDSFEIWNEPDNPAFWTGNAPGFGVAAAACAQAVHAVRPRAATVLGGLTYLNSTFYAQMGTQAIGSLHIAAYHEYTETPWAPTTVERDNAPDDYNGGYDIMSLGGRRAVWMNEGGASTAAAQGYTEQTQASWMRRTVASLLGHQGRPIGLIGLYQLRDPPLESKPIGDPQAQLFFHHTGLFTREGEPKLAAHTIADMAGLLNGHQPTPAQAAYTATAGTPSPMLRLYDLALEDGRQIVFIWDRAASSAGSILLPTTGSRAVLHQPDGSLVPVEGFTDRTLPVPLLQARAVPLLFEISAAAPASAPDPSRR